MLALHVSFKGNWQSDVFPRIWEGGGAGGKYCFYISIARAVQSTGSTDSLVLLWRCGDLQGSSTSSTARALQFLLMCYFTMELC